MEKQPTVRRQCRLMPFAVATRRRLSSLVDRSRKLLPGSSLIREARREQAKMKGARRIEKLSGWLRSWATAIFDSSRYAFLWILLVGLAGLYLLPSEVQLFRLRRSLSFFDDPTEASEFLRTLWQVEASVLALSITVIVFAFQAVSISG
ncbi:MAG TPA: hypothetical protein VNA27_17585 [Rubrobacteraceae bacterium]|nr:hypothetical protein [Rubrobacteraceae bacterium]